MTSTAAAPAWIDLGVPDIEAAKAFYTALFGWTYEDGGPELGHYNQIYCEGRLIGGLMQNVDPEANEQVLWCVYFHTDDLEATLAKVTEHGGQVLVGAMPVADLGTVAIATAPSGAQFGLWQPGVLAGFDVSSAPGSPVWYDTPTSDFAADADFYAAVLGWDVRFADDDPASGFATVGPTHPPRSACSTAPRCSGTTSSRSGGCSSRSPRWTLPSQRCRPPAAK